MKKIFGKMIIATLLFCLSFPTNAAKGNVTSVFSDISAGKWYVEAVQYVYDNDLMSGSEGKFKPTQNITRGQLVTTLYRLAGSPKVTDFRALEAFSDVAPGKYYTDAICWAYNTGVGTGNNGKFQPNNPLTRQQMAAFIFRYTDMMGYDTSIREDYSYMLNADKVGSYAKEAMSWAVGMGLISGSEFVYPSGSRDYDLKPTDNTTRAQVASILQRFCEREKIENLVSYEKNGEGTIAITECKRRGISKIEIPSKIDGMTVTEIGSYAFAYCDNLETVTLPDTIKVIDEGAFFFCESLITIEIPENVVRIGEYAFAGDGDRLSCVLFKGDAPEIDKYTFAGVKCNAYYSEEKEGWDTAAVKEYEGEVSWIYVNGFPEANQQEWLYSENEDGTIRLVQYLGTQALTKFEVPEKVEGKTVTIIGSGLFANMNSLTEITIPDQVKEIESGAFIGCKNLQEISLPSAITAIEKNCFFECSSLKEVVIPEGVTVIEEAAFSYCSSLQKIEIPETVKVIEMDAVSSCDSLKKVVIPRGVEEIGNGAFCCNPSLEKVVVPNTVKKIDNAAFIQCVNLKEVVLEEGLTVLGTNMFAQCESLTEITIPSTVKELPNDIFDYCTSLEKIVLPDGMERIGERAFSKCYVLSEIVIPKSVVKIEKGAFLYCYGLKKIIFEGPAPESEFDIEEPIFLRVEAEVYYPVNDATWNEDVFQEFSYDSKKLTFIAYEAE